MMGINDLHRFNVFPLAYRASDPCVVRYTLVQGKERLFSFFSFFLFFHVTLEGQADTYVMYVDLMFRRVFFYFNTDDTLSPPAPSFFLYSSI